MWRIRTTSWCGASRSSPAWSCPAGTSPLTCPATGAYPPLAFLNMLASSMSGQQNAAAVVPPADVVATPAFYAVLCAKQQRIIQDDISSVLQFFSFYYYAFTLACPWCRAQAPERIHCGEPTEVHMPHCGHVLSSTCSQATRLQARTLSLDSAGAQKLFGSAEAAAQTAVH